MLRLALTIFSLLVGFLRSLAGELCLGVASFHRVMPGHGPVVSWIDGVDVIIPVDSLR
jgi:hypothetical protein